MNINITGGKVKVSLTKPERECFSKLQANATMASHLAESIARQNVETELAEAATEAVSALSTALLAVEVLETELDKHEKGGE